MAQATRLLTAEEFWAMPEPLDHRLELVRGEVIEVPLTGGQHGDIVAAIFALLYAFVRPRRLGKLYANEVGFRIHQNPDTVRGPDVAFVTRDRVPVTGSPEGFWLLAPDLAVEVVSPHDCRSKVEAKTQDYLEAGVQLVWVIWPKTRTVTVYTLDAEPRIFTADETLDGGDVLPGFAASVAELFAVDL